MLRADGSPRLRCHARAASSDCFPFGILPPYLGQKTFGGGLRSFEGGKFLKFPMATILLLLPTLAAALLTPAVHPLAPAVAATRSVPATMFFNFGKKEEAPAPAQGRGSKIDQDFARRQEKLQARQAKAASAPKGQVEVTFPQKGNKVVLAKQGEAIGKVAQRAGIRIKFDCKNGRCGTCQVRLNGRAAAKVCQGAVIPGGATRKVKLTVDNL